MTTQPITARNALGVRAAHLRRLRRRVAATALATFALAVGAVAYDGSMGQATASSAASPATTTSDSTTSNPASPSHDVITTHQS